MGNVHCLPLVFQIRFSLSDKDLNQDSLIEK